MINKWNAEKKKIKKNAPVHITADDTEFVVYVWNTTEKTANFRAAFSLLKLKKHMTVQYQTLSNA